MAYSGEDFFQNYRKTFVISPFDDTQVSPVGYDLRIGSAFLLADPISAEEKLKLDSVMKIKSPEGSIGASPATEVQSRLSGVLVIKPKTSVLVITVEHIHLGSKVMGNVHARASLSAMGLLLNPLTVDPNFGSADNDGGRLILHLHNISARNIEIREMQSIATLVFHEVTTETYLKPHKAGFSGVLDAYREFCEDKVINSMKRYVDERDNSGRGKKEFDLYKKSLRLRT